jgi:hypothetical protein
MMILRYNKHSKDTHINKVKRLNRPIMQVQHSAISKRIGGGIKSHYPPFFIFTSFLP